jgi:D-3-phosphoglycerate dehydrogenase
MDLNQKVSMRILHLEFDQYPVEAQRKLLEGFEVVALQVEDQISLKRYLEKDGAFEAVFTRLGLLLDKEIIDLMPRLKVIATSTTGLNHIDCEYAKANSIAVLSLKGEFEFLSHVKSTAEHTWLLLLSLLRNHIPSVKDVVEQGNWNRLPYLSEEVNGKTMGIIGFGRLGKIVAGYAHAFSAKVLVNDISDIETESYSFVKPVSLEELLAHADIVILMISYSEENLNFFDKSKFALMKENAYFINTSRGELVDEEALLNCLVSGKLRGAALDVLHGDSAWDSKYKGNLALLNYAKNHSNLILTPHMGGFGKTSIGTTRNFIVEKFIKEIQHEN